MINEIQIDTDRKYTELTFRGLRIIIQESDCANGIIVDYWRAHDNAHFGTETFWYMDLEEEEE